MNDSKPHSDSILPKNMKKESHLAHPPQTNSLTYLSQNVYVVEEKDK